MGYTYGIFIYDKVAALDFVGPSETFTVSNYLKGEGRVITIAASVEPITCLSGMRVIPDYTFDNAPAVDVVLVPGTEGVDELLAMDSAIAWVKAQADQVKYMTAVCTGALLLQKAGLLANRKATTHWMLADALANDPSVELMADMRYVRDGNIVTSQGISAGIDMSLWLVGQLYSPAHAREVRKLLQYDPAPPYAAEV